MLKDSFRALSSHNYRLWATGAVVSNLGTWMQRAAQDWIVLTQLSEHNATAVGMVMALQFGPFLPLMPWTGYVADHFDRRKILMITQSTMGLFALGLGILIVCGLVQLWHVYCFALMLGCVTAFDTPARQSFVSELVDENNLSNAVALNATSFNAARVIGPAIAGILIAKVGCGWMFIINALSFVAVICSLSSMRVGELHREEKHRTAKSSLVDGFRYVWKRPDIKTILIMLFLIGTFAINFPIFISTMSVIVFHAGPERFGLLMSMMAVGSVIGAFLTARRARPDISHLLAASAILGVGFTVAAVMPTYWLFGLVLMVIGVAIQTFTTTANSTVQLSTDPAMRGRVMAMFFAIAMGGTPLGAPIVGWVAEKCGPRCALYVGAASGFAAALVLIGYFVKYHKLRFDRQNFRFQISEYHSAEAAVTASSDSAKTTVPVESP